MKNKISISVVIFFTILVIGGGLFFGLFSCGGYVWHQELHISLMAAASIAILIAPPSFLRAIWRRVVFITISLALFVVVRAAASAFYPAPPESLAKFIESFVIGVQYGPC